MFGDGKDRHLAYVLGPSPRLSPLTAAPGPPGGESSRFGELARRLWSPLLACESLGVP